MTIAETSKPSDGEGKVAPAQRFALRAATASSIAVALTATAVAIALVLVKAQGIVLTVFGAIVIAEAMRPLVDRLATRLARGAAIAITFAGLIAVVALVWIAALRELAPQFGAFGRAFPGIYFRCSSFYRTRQG